MTLKPLLALSALTCIISAPTIAFAQTLTYSSATGGAIPDANATGISSTINVSDNFVMTDFTSVTIEGFTHTYLSNLIVTLSHGGTTVDIIDRVRGDGATLAGDASDLNGNYTFVSSGGADFDAAAKATGINAAVPSNVDYATVPVGNTDPPGGVSPANGLLSNFGLVNVSGAWTLNISDRQFGDTGSFTGWRFRIADPSYIDVNTTISNASFNVFPTVRVGNSTSADVTLAADAVVQNVVAFRGSRLVVSGGTATSLRAEDSAKLFMNHGTVSGAVTATEGSTAFINGGTVGNVVTTDNANTYVLAGTFGNASASGSSHIYIYGGASGGAVFSAAGGASISLFGDNLGIDRNNTARGSDGFGNLGTFYNLSGTLTDGTSLFGTQFFDADGGKSIVGGNPGALFFNGVAVVPEPGTFALFGMGIAAFGGLGVISRRRK